MDANIYNADEMVSMLTDGNAKDSKSNIYKLFKTFEKALTDVYTTAKEITEFRCVNIAKGPTLDLLGSNYNVSRAGMHDDIYRIYIKTEIAKGSCNGTYNSVIEMIAYVFNTDVKNVSFVESEAGTVTIEKAPIEELNAVGMSIEQYNAIVQSILPTGISLIVREFEG